MTNTQATDSSGVVPGRSKVSREIKRARTDVELLAEITSKLDRVVSVLAAQGKDRDTQIDILSGAGCDSAFIGTVVGLTAGAVRTYQSRKRGRDPSADKDVTNAAPSV